MLILTRDGHAPLVELALIFHIDVIKYIIPDFWLGLSMCVSMI